MADRNPGMHRWRSRPMSKAGRFDLTGRRALVTGASRGLGLAIARGLAEAGALVLLNGREQKRLDAAQVALAAEGLAVGTAAFDVGDGAGVADAAARLGPIDILVNNAGIQRRGPLEDFAEADWRAVLDTNL